jgi:myo-inositol-1(or 4)-monophosphatase
MTSSELKELTRAVKAIATEAGALLRKGFNKPRKIRYKGRIDPVTEFDLKSEKLITRRILQRFPDHEILAEEGSANGHRSDFCWIVDPLDGTVNFAHGFPIYAVSIAVSFKGEIITGAVFDPERNELFWSARGSRAYMNRQVITVSKEGNLERSLLATGFAYDIGTARKNNLGLFARMAKKAQGVRRPGSAALDLCWLAAGRIDGFWELKLHPWDTAAATLIVANAGGKISRIDGRPYSVFDPDLLASNGRIHHAMASVLNGPKS